MNQTVTTGIVLSRTNYEEADRIITVLTADQGKIRVLARGVRKVKSKLAAGIELFSVSDISFIRGRGEVGTLTSSRLKKHFGNIVSDVNRTTTAYDFLRIINKSTEDNAEKEFFDLLQTTLESLNNLDIDLEIIKLWFDIQLITITGHAPNLKTTSDGRELRSGATYNFDTEKMSFIDHPDGLYTSSHIKLLRLAQANNPTKLQKVRGLDNLLPNVQLLTSTMRKTVLHH